MGLDGTTKLVDAIQRSQLLEPAQLRQLTTNLQERFTDVRSLGKHLVQQGWLTPYQVNQLLNGQATNLVLGPYRITERLGEGGMGQVYKARHQQLNRTVALKVIRREHLANPNAVRRFQREAQAAAQLAHPNIVTLYDAGQVNDVHFLAMEYVAGIDLAQRVAKKGPLPVAEACEYIRQAALGLQHAHERGLVHRDIKPANLLLAKTATGVVVKVLDMGVARVHGTEETDDAQQPLTQDGSVMGTPDFMAPEQAKNSRKIDHRADLYSLGCTLFYLLTGKVPFPGGTTVEKLLMHQLEEAPRVDTLRPDTPPAVVKIIQQLLAKRPEDRGATAADLARDLAHIDDKAAPAPPRRRRGLLVGSVAGAALLLLASVGVAWWALTEPEPLPAPAVTPAPRPTMAGAPRHTGDDAPWREMFGRGKGGFKGPRAGEGGNPPYFGDRPGMPGRDKK